MPATHLELGVMSMLVHPRADLQDIATDWCRRPTWDGLDVADAGALDVATDWGGRPSWDGLDIADAGALDVAADWGGWASWDSLNHFY